MSERAKVLEEFVRDLADYGVRHDTTPTHTRFQTTEESEAFWIHWCRKIDRSITERARDALRRATFEDARSEKKRELENKRIAELEKLLDASAKRAAEAETRALDAKKMLDAAWDAHDAARVVARQAVEQELAQTRRAEAAEKRASEMESAWHEAMADLHRTRQDLHWSRQRESPQMQKRYEAAEKRAKELEVAAKQAEELSAATDGCRKAQIAELENAAAMMRSRITQLEADLAAAKTVPAHKPVADVMEAARDWVEDGDAGAGMRYCDRLARAVQAAAGITVQSVRTTPQPAPDHAQEQVRAEVDAVEKWLERASREVACDESIGALILAIRALRKEIDNAKQK